jgi:hypothetical protein
MHILSIFFFIMLLFKVLLGVKSFCFSSGGAKPHARAKLLDWLVLWLFNTGSFAQVI